jgi:hypothetical protein
MPDRSSVAAGRQAAEVGTMKSFLKYAALIATPLVLVFAIGSTASGSPPAGKVKTTKGWVETVAMSGSQVAYSTGGGLPYGPGDKVYLWNVRTGKGRLIGGHNPDPVYEVAMSSTRIAWIARGGTAPDPTAEINESLFSASIRKASQPDLLDSAYRTETSPVVPEVPGGCTGDWIGGLAGSQNILVVNRWQTAGVNSDIGRAELDQITSLAGFRQRLSGGLSLVAQSTDGAHIAVLRSRGAWPAAGDLCGTTTAPTAGIYSPAGKLLGEFGVAGAKELAVSGDNLAVLTTASRLDVYKWRSARLVHSWHVPQVRYVHLEDVYGQIAVYSAYSQGRNLHLLQLSNGKDVLLTKGSGLLFNNREANDAQLEAPGLVYAVDMPGVKARSKLVFVPMRRVLAALAKGHVR